MKRYYYDCSVKAAYVQKYHNVQLVSGQFVNFVGDEVRAEDRFYVHPDCHHLINGLSDEFKPKIEESISLDGRDSPQAT